MDINSVQPPPMSTSATGHLPPRHFLATPLKALCHSVDVTYGRPPWSAGEVSGERAAAASSFGVHRNVALPPFFPIWRCVARGHDKAECRIPPCGHSFTYDIRTEGGGTVLAQNQMMLLVGWGTD